jgi:hypothetical protein
VRSLLINDNICSMGMDGDWRRAVDNHGKPSAYQLLLTKILLLSESSERSRRAEAVQG